LLKELIMAAREDLKAGERDVSWDPQDLPKSIEELRKFVKDKADEAIRWYWKAKRWKKRAAIGLRVTSIFIASAAAVIPILSQMITDNANKPVIAPAWASVALIAAGVFVVLDRLLGCSSSWIRYVLTGLRLQKKLDEFQIEWHCEKAKWKDAKPTDAQTQAMCAKAKDVVTAVDELIIEETNAWVAEFKSALKQIDELAKMKEQIKKHTTKNR
jgi:hypothetical protein